jgi:F5/8 type C domain
MLPLSPLLLVAIIVAVWYFTRSTSKSVEPTPEAVVPAVTAAAAGNVEFVQKAKYVELKKISSPNPGPANYAGIMNVGSIMLYPKGSTAPLPASALTATASSQFAAGHSADQVLNYDNPASFWHSKLTPDLGEWVRVELKEPTALDHITFLNRADVAGSNVEAVRMLGTQVSILDADSKPIKTYVVTEKSPSYTFAAS